METFYRPLVVMMVPRLQTFVKTHWTVCPGGWVLLYINYTAIDLTGPFKSCKEPKKSVQPKLNMQSSHSVTAPLVFFSLKRYFTKWRVDTQYAREGPIAENTSNISVKPYSSLREELEPHLFTKLALYLYSAFCTMAYKYVVFSQISKNANCFNICKVKFKKIKGSVLDLIFIINMNVLICHQDHLQFCSNIHFIHWIFIVYYVQGPVLSTGGHDEQSKALSGLMYL